MPVFLLLLVYSLLLIPSVQKKIVDTISQEISKTTGSYISIGSLYFKPFSKIDIRQVYAEDLQGDTLAYVDRLSAGFNLFHLLNKKLTITSVDLDGFLLDAKKDSLAGDANFQFLIDAFASNDSVEEEPQKGGLVIRIDDVSIKRGRLYYNIADQEETDSLFNPNHIRVEDFQASMSLRSIDLKRLNVKLRQLSFREHSGFELSNLQARLSSRKEVIKLEELKLELPSSELAIPELTLDYTGFDISRIADSASFKGNLEGSLLPADLKAFYQPLEEIGDWLEFRGRLEGSLPLVELQELEIRLGKIADLQGRASLEDYMHWEDSHFSVHIDELAVYPAEARDLLGKLAEVSLPEIVDELGPLRLKASAVGKLPTVRLQASLATRPGKIELSGDAGYKAATGNTSFDLQVQVPDYDLQALLQDTLMGKAGLHLWAKGGLTAQGQVNAQAGLQLKHFMYNKYRYEGINADLTYRGDSISVQALSNDSNVLFSAAAMYRMPPKGKAEGYVQLAVDRLSPQALHLLPEYKIQDIKTSIQGHISGNTPDEYTGKLQLDSLKIRTEKGLFRQDSIWLSLDQSEAENTRIHLQSGLVDADISGRFSLTTIASSFNNTIHRLLPSLIPHQEVKGNPQNELDVRMRIGKTDQLSDFFSLPFTIKEAGSLNMSYREVEQHMNLQADFPLILLGTNAIRNTRLEMESGKQGESLSAKLEALQTGPDTTKVALLTFIEKDSIDLNLHAGNKNLDLDGTIALGVKFEPPSTPESLSPDLFINIYPTEIKLRKQSFDISRSLVSIIGDTYTVDHFSIAHPDKGNISANGMISSNEQDSLLVSFGHLHLAPFTEMVQYEGVKVDAVINGGVVMKNLLQSPFFITDDLTIKEIAIADKKIGDMDILSAWSDKHQGVLLNINLHQSNQRQSSIKGFALPYRDSLSVKIDLNALEIQWMEPFAEGMLSNLSGTMGATITAHGKISKPTLNGLIYFDQATFGVDMTGVDYSISDSIHFTYESIDFKRFNITDNKGNTASVSGKVSHDNFERFNVDLKLQARDFLLLNNPSQKDSLFYGTLKAQANIDITGTEKGLNIDGTIRRGTSGEFYMHIPESQTEANRYENIVYINTEEETEDETTEGKRTTKTPLASSIPIKVSVNMEVTPAIKMGVILNPSTHDAATVSGNGNILFNYHLPSNEMSLLGDYTIEEGKCVISLKNIVKREFTVEKGSKVVFKGDPLAAEFDITAVYAVKADLVTLDQSFANDLSNTRVTTNCIIKVSGNMDKMDISYSLKLPNVDESVQRKVENLIYSDDIRIKQVAYLLALSSFYPPGGNQGTGPRTSIWTSLASSTLSSQLNNILSGVLNENWSVGTSLRSNDNNFSDVEMDVNVSTTLFNNRLIVNTNLGYKNNTTQQNNITGDFLVEYKLTRSGTLRLKAYNVTNDEYFKTAPTTQGLGVVYKKDAKTFKELFKDTLNRLSRMRNMGRRPRPESDDKKDKDTQTQSKDAPTDNNKE